MTKAAAEALKFEAEARKAAAEAQLAEEQARAASAEADIAEISAARERRKRDLELATDEYQYVYRLADSISSGSVRACIDKLAGWHRICPNCAVTLVLNSPGGTVIDGMALWDFLMEFRKEHHLTTVARGMAASMAGILLQAGHKRVMGAEASFLIHEGSFGAGGSMGEVEDTVEWVKKIHDRILDIFASRSRLTKAQIRRRWHRKDWWMTSAEALKFGFVDEVGGGGVV